jgi:hypothetical protein
METCVDRQTPLSTERCVLCGHGVVLLQAVKLCDRNFGIGGDGVIFALPPNEGASATVDRAHSMSRVV